MPPDRDDLDGCDIVGILAIERPTRDDEIWLVVLFADVDPNEPDAIERRAREWQELFG